MYVRATPNTKRFAELLLQYYVSKCKDKDFGFSVDKNRYVDLGHPDQNIFDAVLGNYDHRRPMLKADVGRWRAISMLQKRLRWKLLDTNSFAMLNVERTIRSQN